MIRTPLERKLYVLVSTIKVHIHFFLKEAKCIKLEIKKQQKRQVNKSITEINGIHAVS